MSPRLTPNCLPVLIGSMPLDDHSAASRLMMEFTPAIPLWIQLPVFPQEGMVPQFLPGMPAMINQEIAKRLNQIRLIVATNLVLGVLTIIVGASARFW